MNYLNAHNDPIRSLVTAPERRCTWYLHMIYTHLACILWVLVDFKRAISSVEVIDMLLYYRTSYTDMSLTEFVGSCFKA